MASLSGTGHAFGSKGQVKDESVKLAGALTVLCFERRLHCFCLHEAPSELERQLN